MSDLDETIRLRRPTRMFLADPIPRQKVGFVIGVRADRELTAGAVGEGRVVVGGPAVFVWPVTPGKAEGWRITDPTLPEEAIGHDHRWMVPARR